MRPFIAVVFLLIISCGVKQTRYAINSGEYDEAIAIAINNLRTNKDKKGKQDYIYMLEEAFQKAKERDLNQINFLIKQNTPRNYEQIYNLYAQLEQRQQDVRPLLPLKIIDQNRFAKFKFDDYSDKLIKSRSDLVQYLYDNANALLLTTNKSNYREAFETLTYLKRLEPDYKNTNNLIDQAFYKGADYVVIETLNNTGMLIPLNLQRDLMTFSTKGIDEKWTVYHSSRLSNISYDYNIIVDFRTIKISPDLLREREFAVKKEIIEKRKKRDRRGQIINDSLGNPIYEEVVKNLAATIFETTQSKNVEIVAKVDYVNLKSNQVLESFPLQSQFVFQNIFARYDGDINAVDSEYRPLFNKRAVPFPTNEQMVFDTGEDLKSKVKNIITSNKITR